MIMQNRLRSTEVLELVSGLPSRSLISEIKQSQECPDRFFFSYNGQELANKVHVQKKSPAYLQDAEIYVLIIAGIFSLD